MCHEVVVVVGVDGSSASDAALRHALFRAHTYGGSVELVTAWPSHSTDGEDEAVLYRAGHRWAVQTQRAAIERTRSLIAQAPPVTGVVGDCDPAELLSLVGTRAACIVLGKRTDEPVRTACDSIRERCMALTERPVVVVPESGGGQLPEKGPKPAVKQRPELAVEGAPDGGRDALG